MKTSSNSPTPRLAFLLGLGLFFSATAAQAQTDVWVGGATAGPSEYALPANWSLGRVPGPMDDALIPLTANQPMINNLGIARTLTINPSATLTIGQLGNLDLYGNLVDNGILIANGSITTRGTTLQVLDGTAAGTGGVLTLTDLIILGAGGATLQTPVRLSRSLQLTGNLTTTPPTGVGPLTLLSTPTNTAFVVNNGTGVVNGTVTMQRAINITTSNINGTPVNPGVGYRHYSSPVSNTTVADLVTPTFTPVLNLAYNTSPTPPATVPFPTVYFYDQGLVNRTNTSPDFDKGFFVPASLATPLVVGRGVTANLNGSELEDFVGTLNNGDITPPPTPSTAALGLPGNPNLYRSPSTTLNSASAGYQFLGNPYPSPIDFRMIATADRGPIYNTLYVYQSTSQYGGVYRTYSGTTGVGNPIIPSGQGFMVRVTTPGASGTFTFRNSQRVTGSDFTTFMRPVADTRPQLELTLGNSIAPELDFFNLVFQPGSTTGDNDQYDALKAPNQNGMSVNTTTPSGEALAIDGRPTPTGETAIPLHVGVSENGTYTLNVSKLDNFKGMYVYLRDKQKSTLTDLSQQASYTFTTSAANTSARFELVVSSRPVENASAALAKQVALYPNPAKGSASLELPASIGDEMVSASLIDAMGRTVRTLELPAQGSVAHQLDLRGLAAGVYAVRLRTSAGTIVNRLTVE